LNDQELLRYSRHILLPEIGIEGQEKLLAARALVVGAGGLGSPAAYYLASAGIGTLVLADGDTVDLTNLQRQILHHTGSVGRPKAESGRETLGRINPECRVIPCVERLVGERLEEEVAAADVVLDCCDNFATRHAVNRACVRHRKPLVSGAAIRFDGQVAVFDSRRADAPCYECLFPEAAEALKLVIGCGESLAGRLLLLDGLAMEWRAINVPKDPACAVCSGQARQEA